MRPWIKWGLLLAAASLFGLSLLMPAVVVDDGTVWAGFKLLAVGWIGVVVLPAWLANVAWLVAGVMIAHGWRGSLWVILLGWALAATAIPGFSMVGAHEGTTGAAHVTTGFWVWMSSPLPLVWAVWYKSPRASVAI